MPGSGNISQLRGKGAEKVVLEHFCSQSYSLLGVNQKLFGVEVDLLFFKDHYHLVEVKSLRCWDEVGFRVSLKQRERLEYARHRLEDQGGQAVELWFAFVGSDGIMVLSLSDLL